MHCIGKDFEMLMPFMDRVLLLYRQVAFCRDLDKFCKKRYVFLTFYVAKYSVHCTTRSALQFIPASTRLLGRIQSCRQLLREDYSRTFLPLLEYPDLYSLLIQ